jgi:hypothetical protein
MAALCSFRAREERGFSIAYLLDFMLCLKLQYSSLPYLQIHGYAFVSARIRIDFSRPDPDPDSGNSQSSYKPAKRYSSRGEKRNKKPVMWNSK